MSITDRLEADRPGFVCFRVSRRRLALPLVDIIRAVPVPLLEQPVGAPGFLEGVFDFHGTPTAAIRLDRLLRLEDDRMGIYSALLVLRDVSLPLAFHVSAVESVLKTTAADLQPVDADSTFNACVTHRIGAEGETIYVLATDRLLLAEEKSRVAGLLAARQARLAEAAGPDAESTREVAHAS